MYDQGGRDVPAARGERHQQVFKQLPLLSNPTAHPPSDADLVEHLVRVRVRVRLRLRLRLRVRLRLGLGLKFGLGFGFGVGVGFGFVTWIAWSTTKSSTLTETMKALQPLDW